MRKALVAAALLFLAGCGSSDIIKYEFTPEDDTARCGTMIRAEYPEWAGERYYPVGRYCRQEG